MRILLGVGNPGAAYASTRHNVGWAVLDSLVDSLDTAPEWDRGDGPLLVATPRMPNDEYVLVKPTTFVNRSGDAAEIACDTYGCDPADLLIVVDDVHLPPGDIRLRQGGAPGGHNGTASIIESLETDRVPRLRIGIGAPPRLGALIEHVLSPFAPDEMPVIESAMGAAARIAKAFGQSGYDGAGAAFSRWRSLRAREEQRETPSDDVAPDNPSSPA